MCLRYLPNHKKVQKIMKIKITTLRKGLIFIFCILLSILAFAVPARAENDDSKVIFVAGNPDLYPIEYYDASKKEYLGLMPDIYTAIEENTSYTFEYVQPGTTNSQNRLARNSQAEIVSAYIDGDVNAKYIKNAIPVTLMDTGDGEKTVYIAFTGIATDSVVNDITKAVTSITDAQKLEMLASHTQANDYRGSNLIWVYILAPIAGAAVIALIVVSVKHRKKTKEDEQDSMIDPDLGIGNDKYYAYCFDDLISDKSKALYYVAYIGFDAEEFSRKFGDEGVREMQKFTAEFLSRQTTAVEYLAFIHRGVFTFIYQAPNMEVAEIRIAKTIEELDFYLSNIRNEYAKWFNAGVCSLEHNMDCNAETAFYNAKQGYLHAVEKNLVYAFSTREIIVEAHRLEGLNQRVLDAIENDEFVIYLQPIMDMKGNPFAAEALSRWQHPQEGLLLPWQYIDMINQSETITLHDLNNLSLVCRQLQAWKGTDKENLIISCNFTRYSLSQDGMFDKIKEVVDKYDFDHGNLIIETTEDSISPDPEILKINLEKCRDLGILIALDDIGSGYSALTDLYNYPIDYIKIERNILLQTRDRKGERLLDGLICLSHNMHTKVVCEGIETEEQLKIIRKTCCDYIQGFYYSRPLPVKEFEKFLVQQNSTV